MRTNIQLDDDLLAEAAKYSTVRSKRAIVHEALATYVAVKQEERRRLSYRERLQRVRSQAANARLRTDTRDLLRKDRDTR
jgi:Arc/MetJ family transcription regulator